jgi:hypothetical protein
MQARDIPVLGGLLDAIIIFASTLTRIIRHPFGFVHEISFEDPEETRRAFKFLGAGIAFGYLLLSPALRKHSFEVSEFLFGVLVLFRLLLVAVIYHAAFLVVGHRRPIKTSLILGSYINGVYFPFFMAVMLPGYMAIGPQYYFDALNDRAFTTEQISALEDPLVLPALLLFFLAFPIFYAVTCRWWASAYGANVWMSALLLFTAIAVAGLANFYILSPVVRPFL